MYWCVTRCPPLMDTHLHILPLTVWLQARCMLPTSDAPLSFPQLSVRLQERSMLSNSLRCASPSSAAVCPATGALHTLHLSKMRIPPLRRYLSSNRCVARSLPLGRASPLFTCICPAESELHALHLSALHLPFSPLSVRLQARCVLSTSLGCAYPPFVAICQATGAFHAFHLSDGRLPSPKPSVQYWLYTDWDGHTSYFQCLAPPNAPSPVVVPTDRLLSRVEFGVPHLPGGG